PAQTSQLGEVYGSPPTEASPPPTDHGPDLGCVTTSHINGRAGWRKSPSPDLARDRGGKPPGLLYNGIFAPVSVGAHPRNPTAWTPQRLWVPLPARAGRRAGEVRGESSGCSGGESLETARRWGGRMAHGRAHAHRYARDLRARMSTDR